MPSHHLTLTLLALLLPFILGLSPQCSEPNACYGMPVNCRPDTNCHLILKFDAQGNLDLHVNDIADPMAYVAVALETSEEDGETEYVICIPHQQRRLRGIAHGEEPVRITEQPMAKYVTQVSANAFVCSFLATELPPNFQTRDVFSVVEGVYEENLVIPQGEQLSEPLYLHPVAFRSSSISDDSEDVMSPDERKATSDFLGTLRRINGGIQEDSELEETDEGEEEDALEDLLDKKYSTRKRDEEKKKVSRRRQEDSEEESPRKKSKSRPSRYQDDDEEEEEEEEEETPKRKPSKKSRRRDSEEEDEYEEGDDAEEAPRKKKNQGKKGGRRGRKEKSEEDEDKDDEYTDEQGSNEDDDEDNGSNHVATLAIIAVLVVVMIEL